MRISSRVQVTIPQAIREQTGLLVHTEVELVVEGMAVRIVRAAPGKGVSHGVRAARSLGDQTAGVRMTTDEIIALARGEA